MEKFFQYLNIFPMPLWLAMMFFPDHPLTEKAGRSSTIFGLAALHYLLSLVVAIKNGFRERATPGEAKPGRLSFTSLEGIRVALSSPSGTLAAWSHMLALDLFTGAWIYRQAQRLGAPHAVRIGSLFFTLMAGPTGLLIFLIWRVVGTGQSDPLHEA